jgi:hypothetical protein
MSFDKLFNQSRVIFKNLKNQKSKIKNQKSKIKNLNYFIEIKHKTIFKFIFNINI